MASIIANLAGGIQALAPSYQMSGKLRIAGGSFTMASQTAPTYIGLARIRLPIVLCGIKLIVSATLGSSTLAFGNSGSGNTALYAAAATYTSANVISTVGLAANLFTEITTGFDSTTGLATTYASGQSSAPLSSGFGGLYEDVLVTTGAATLPSSGTITAFVEYAID
jgi:hypothetical protein